MQPDLLAQPAFFETPARVERLQLLLHLARNAVEPVYLRAPAGAGKTRLVTRLRDELDADLAVVSLDLSEPVKPIAGILQQLGLPPEAADDWPQQLMAMLAERQLLVIVDSADTLDASHRKLLAPLSQAGACLLLVGRGDGPGDWQVQYVDLPPLSADESAAFLRAVAGDSAERVTADAAATAHALAKGLPGPLLDALRGLLAAESPGAAATGEQPSASPQQPESVAGEPDQSGSVDSESVRPEPAAVAAAQPEPEQPEPEPSAPEQPDPEQPAPPQSESGPSGHGRSEPAPANPAQPAARSDVPAEPAAARTASGKQGSVRSKNRRGPQPVDADKVLHGRMVGPWAWVGGAVLGLILVGVLVFQDSINSLFAPAETGPAPVVELQPRLLESESIAPLPDAEQPVESVSDVPPIALPELAVPPVADEASVAGAGDEPLVDDPIESLPQPVAEPEVESAGSPSPASDSATGDDPGDDPLDAVMQDALAAESPEAGDAEPEPATVPSAASASAVSVAEGADEAGSPPPTAAADQSAALVTDSAPSPPEVAPTPAVVPPEPVATPDNGADVVEVTTTQRPEDVPAPVEDRGIPAVALREAGTGAERPAAADGPAPVEDRTPLLASRPPAVAAAPATSGDAWLNSREPKHYTLQLVGARDRASIDKFVRDHGISAPFAVFERQLSGAAWYSLVAGDYPDRDAAVAARDRLPAALTGSGVWPRTFESIQSAR